MHTLRNMFLCPYLTFIKIVYIFLMTTNHYQNGRVILLFLSNNNNNNTTSHSIRYGKVYTKY